MFHPSLLQSAFLQIASLHGHDNHRIVNPHSHGVAAGGHRAANSGLATSAPLSLSHSAVDNPDAAAADRQHRHHAFAAGTLFCGFWDSGENPLAVDAC
jgi:hypothetical protein